MQIADALAKAHKMGITHRDLKPSNDSNLVYRSVIAFGKVRVMEGSGVAEKKRWFIDFWSVSNDSNSTYDEPYPEILDRIILYEVELEMVTGKRNIGRH